MQSNFTRAVSRFVKENRQLPQTGIISQLKPSEIIKQFIKMKRGGYSPGTWFYPRLGKGGYGGTIPRFTRKIKNFHKPGWSRFVNRLKSLNNSSRPKEGQNRRERGFIHDWALFTLVGFPRASRSGAIFKSKGSSLNLTRGRAGSRKDKTPPPLSRPCASL